MTHEQLLNLAKRRGYIRWLKSRIIERIWFDFRKKKILVMRPITKKMHVIDPVAEYDCEEIDRSQKVSLGELLKS